MAPKAKIIASLQVVAYLLILLMLSFTSLHIPILAAVANFLSVKTMYVLADSPLIKNKTVINNSVILGLVFLICYSLLFFTPWVSLSLAMMAEVRIYDTYIKSSSVFLGKVLWYASVINLSLVPLMAAAWVLESQAFSEAYPAEAWRAFSVSEKSDIWAPLNTVEQFFFR